MWKKLFVLLLPVAMCFPPEHLDHLLHEYQEGVENLKRTARDIKVYDSDGDVIKIIKTDPIIVRGKVIYLDSPPATIIERIYPASIEIDDSGEIYIEDDGPYIIKESPPYKFVKYIKVYSG